MFQVITYLLFGSNLSDYSSLITRVALNFIIPFLTRKLSIFTENFSDQYKKIKNTIIQRYPLDKPASERDFGLIKKHRYFTFIIIF